MYGRYYIARHIIIDESHPKLGDVKPRRRPHHHYLIALNLALFVVLCIVAGALS